jgi:hypothetical protein
MAKSSPSAQTDFPDRNGEVEECERLHPEESDTARSTRSTRLLGCQHHMNSLRFRAQMNDGLLGEAFTGFQAAAV